jgi:hypothetical protein
LLDHGKEALVKTKGFHPQDFRGELRSGGKQEVIVLARDDNRRDAQDGMRVELAPGTRREMDVG